MKPLFTSLCALPLLGLLTACGGTGSDYVPINDGAPAPGFETDLAACQEVARQKPLIDGETREDALIGATIGALAGLAEDDVSGLGGALVGGAVGGTAGALERREDRAEIVTACMKGRGHAVVG